MSHVTNAILSFGILEQADDRMAEVNAALLARPWNETREQQFGPDIGDIDTAYGGMKCLETPIHMAAFNHFGPNQILECVAEARWEYPAAVQLIVQDQHVEVFTILTLASVAEVQA